MGVGLSLFEVFLLHEFALPSDLADGWDERPPKSR